MLTHEDWLLDPSESIGFESFEKGTHLVHGHQVHHTEYIMMRTPKRYALVNITNRVQEILNRANVEDGFCYIGAMHITAGVYVNDAESGLLTDIAKWIEKLAPYGENYLHHRTGEDNGDAHLKSYLTNHQIMLPITRGKLDLGTWQQVFYAEFDGLRHKRIIVKIAGVRPN